MSEKYWVLKSSDVFSNLDEDEIRRLESSARVRDFPRGTPVYLPADEADGLLILAKGRVKICHLTPDGKQSILSIVNRGELFGELSILDSVTRDEYAEAIEPSRVIMIAKSPIQSLMNRHPTVTLGFNRLFGLRRQQVERRLKYLLFRSNRERLIHLLIELVEQYGRVLEDEDEVELGIKLSHQDMASMIGSTRETVTVLLGELQQQGWIKLARRRVVIKQLQKMARSVSADLPKTSVPSRRPRQVTEFKTHSFGQG